EHRRSDGGVGHSPRRPHQREQADLRIQRLQGDIQERQGLRRAVGGTAVGRAIRLPRKARPSPAVWQGRSRWARTRYAEAVTPRFRFEQIADSGPENYDVPTHAPGPSGALPVSAEMLRQRASGDLFGWTQNAGMGWSPARLGGAEVLLMSTHGGIRAADGTPVALGYHTGHWEVGLLMQAAAAELQAAGAVPFAGYCTDPCDGRTQGTSGMFDSLPYRNDAAIVFRRLIRSLPTRRAVIGFATCDKGLPAMMMALAGTRDLPAVLVPGGVTLLASDGEDTARVQTIGA